MNFEVWKLGKVIEEDLNNPEKVYTEVIDPEKKIVRKYVSYIANVGMCWIGDRIEMLTESDCEDLLKCLNISIRHTGKQSDNSIWECSFHTSKFRRLKKYDTDNDCFEQIVKEEENRKNCFKDFLETLAIMADIAKNETFYSLSISNTTSNTFELTAKLNDHRDHYDRDDEIVFIIKTTDLNLPEQKEQLTWKFEEIIAKRNEERRIAELKRQALNKLTEEERKLLGLKV